MFTISTGSLTLNLPNPQWDDTRDYDTKSSMRRNLDDSLVVSRPAIRNQMDVHTYTFTVTCTPDKAMLVSFFAAARGQLLSVSWDSESFNAILAAEDVEIVTIRRDQWDVTIKLVLI